MPKCPKCSAALSSDQVVGGVARCQWCNEVWEPDGAPVSSGPASSPASRVASASGSAPRTSAPPEPAAVPRQRSAERAIARREDWRPYGVGRVEDGDVVVLQVSWLADAPKVFLVLSSACVLGFGAWLVSVGGLLGPGSLVLLVLLYMIAQLVVNRSVVRVGSEEVEVWHGPLPTLFDRSVTLPTTGLSRVAIVETTQHRRLSSDSQTDTYYSLKANDQVLLRKFSNEETVRYVASVIADTAPGRTKIVRR